MSNKYKVLLVSTALLSAYAFGRWSAPEKLKIETKTVEVEKKVENSEANKHKETTTTESVKPDGTKETVIRVVEDTNKKTAETYVTAVKTDTLKEVTKSSSKMHLSLLTGATLNLSTTNPIIFGGSFSREVLGLINLGVWAMSNKTGGFSIGLSF